MGGVITFNILVIDDNLPYSKNLINFLAQNNPMIRLVSMITDGKEAIDYLSSSSNSIDIILLDMGLPNYNGEEILDFIKCKNLYKYVNSVIIISGEYNFKQNLTKNEYIYTYINKSRGLETILEKVNDLIEEKNLDLKSIEKKILKEFQYLKFNANFIGTKYLLESIIVIIDEYRFKDYNLKRDIYPIIAAKHKKSVNNIKCNINNATTFMNCDCEKKCLMDYFHFSDIMAEAKPKQVIDTIIRKILI